MVAFVSLKREAIHRAVRQMYTAVAEHPAQRFHFPTGRRAGELLGYPETLLAQLPERAVESFAGVGYPFVADTLAPGTGPRPRLRLGNRRPDLRREGRAPRARLRPRSHRVDARQAARDRRCCRR